MSLLKAYVGSSAGTGREPEAGKNACAVLDGERKASGPWKLWHKLLMY